MYQEENYDLTLFWALGLSIRSINNNTNENAIKNGVKMSPWVYLRLWHDALAKYLMKATLKNNHLNSNFITNRQPESDINFNDFKYWWNFWIRTTTTIPVNKLDLSVSHKSIEICKNIEFSCHTDAKITSKDQDEINHFQLLVTYLIVSTRIWTALVWMISKLKCTSIKCNALSHVVRFRYAKRF